MAEGEAKEAFPALRKPSHLAPVPPGTSRRHTSNVLFGGVNGFGISETWKAPILAPEPADGGTRLHDAVLRHDEEAVAALLKAEGEGAVNLGAQDALGRTALHIATTRDDVDIIKLLVRAKHPLEYEDCAGYTPVHIATAVSSISAVAFLVLHGANVNAKGPMGTTPLHTAVANGHTGIVQTLMEAGGQHSARDVWGLTPMHWACAMRTKRCATVVEWLIRLGCRMNVQDASGSTPMDWAERLGNVAVVQLLESQGVGRRLTMKPDGIDSLGGDGGERQRPVTIAVPSASVDSKRSTKRWWGRG